MNGSYHEDGRNTIIVLGISILILISWQYLFGFPELESKSHKEAVSELLENPEKYSSVPYLSPEGSSNMSSVLIQKGRKNVLSSTPRVQIDTPKLRGSINLRGGRIDDISLKEYHQTIDPKSDEIILFSPFGTDSAYYASFGWVTHADTKVRIPDSQTRWEVESGEKLTPETPVVLVYENGEGLRFQRTFSVDHNYMISVSNQVFNRTGAPIFLYPYSALNIHETPDTQGSYLLHEGIIGHVNQEEGLQRFSFEEIQEKILFETKGKNGWFGLVDKYWSSVLIADSASAYDARVKAFPKGGDFTYQISFLYDLQEIPANGTREITTRLFSGAKEVDLINSYAQEQQIPHFDLLIDWGIFYFITKPLFSVLHFFYELSGNFGIAILCVTLLIKLLFFPLAYKSYVVMSRLKLLQPELLKIKEKYGDDPAQQQREMMKFYKEQKVNPAAGCLPVLAQIPVFFALYKVLFITTEMRHAPFFGWIQDLAAPDPTNLFSLFGLLPWDPSMIPVLGVFLHVGIWPILMGITMFIQMRISATSTDPMQAKILAWMPVFFTMILATFPAGLVIYWTFNNTLSIIQQVVIMKRQGVEVELWGNLKSTFSRTGSPSEPPQ